MNLTINAQNLEKAIAQLENLDKRTQNKVIREGLKKAAAPIRNDARLLAPRRTGKGAQGITARARVRRGEGEMRIGFTRKRWYMRLHETGTVKMPARPFLRPAFDTNVQRAADEFFAEFERQIAAAVALQSPDGGGEAEFELPG